MKVLKSNNKVLKSANKWLSINNPTVAQVPVTWGNNTSLNFIHQTGKFEIEFDYINTHPTNAMNTVLLGNNFNNALTGFYFIHSINKSFAFYLMLAGGGGTTKSINMGVLYNNINYKIKVVGNGTTITGYVNNVAVAPVVLGTLATGNAERPFNIAGLYYLANSYERIFKIRNLTIKNNYGITVLNLPLQDISGLSKNIIDGVVGTSNLLKCAVTDIDDGGNWAYFNGVPTTATIGTPSTLGWMNSGVFNMEYEWIAIGSCSYVFHTCGNAQIPRMGFSLFTYTNFVWTNGIAWTTMTLASTLVYGKVYRTVIKGDGSKLYFTTYNTDGSINTTNEPTGVACTFIPNATTFYSLNFGVVIKNYQIRNFKIFTDFEGTIPFMDLPMQDASTLMTDRVTGLQGSATGVQIVNNNTNVLKTTNKWCKVGAVGATGSINNIGVANQFNFIHQTGIFEIELEYYLNGSPQNYSQFLLGNQGSVTTTTNGITIHRPGASQTYICVTLVSGNVAVNTTINIANFFTDGDVPYKIKVVGTGSSMIMTKNINNIITTYNIPYVNPIVATGNSLAFSSCAAIPSRGLLVRNLRISNGTNNVLIAPLTYGGNIGKDIVGGLQGTVTNCKVIEL